MTSGKELLRRVSHDYSSFDGQMSKEPGTEYQTKSSSAREIDTTNVGCAAPRIVPPAAPTKTGAEAPVPDILERDVLPYRKAATVARVSFSTRALWFLVVVPMGWVL